VTDQVQADKDKRLLEEQLRQSQKFEAIGTLAGGIAHDFNNFLTVITSYCTLIERRIAENDPVRQYLDNMISATERAAKLTSSLLAYSRKQTLAPRSVHLKDIIHKVGSLLERILGEDIELSLQLADEPLAVMADSLQIEQTLMNLAANARDAMPNGGVFQIAAERLELDSEFVKLHGYGIPGQYALITVSDTGEGMDAESKGRIFEPFFTTKEVGKGTGLGLSMVYGTVKQHNGYINAYSEPGKGSTFRIYFPLTELDQTETVCRVESASLRGGSETILLVEDDAGIRKSLKELLEEDGYTIIDAVDGEDGIRRFKERQGEIQLLLLDVIMPKMNGLEVWETVKAISCGVKVIFMSGYTANILSAKGMHHGDVNLISKPVTINGLSAKIREVLDK
jgi:nitrogen-specific signal transduction histidine kinase/CheY-like chemotaxis protein